MLGSKDLRSLRVDLAIAHPHLFTRSIYSEIR